MGEIMKESISVTRGLLEKSN